VSALLLGCAWLSPFVVGVRPASAARPEIRETASFAKPGTFGHPTGVAVDQATGNVFVAESEANEVRVSNSEGGGPAGGGPDHIAELGFRPSETEGVAVDDSCYLRHLTGAACEASDPSNGAIYIAESGANVVAKFKLNTSTNAYEKVGALNAVAGSEPNGVAVDMQGNVYIPDYAANTILEFDNAGVKLGTILVGSIDREIEHPGYIAVGTPGVLYVGDYQGGVAKIEVNSEDVVQSESVLDRTGKAVAVDALGNVYVDDETHVSEYSPTGALIEEFGATFLEASVGLAVQDQAEDVYVSNAGSANDLVAFGPSAVSGPPPAALTGPAEEETADTATLTGTVRPEGSPSKYWFDYGLSESYGAETRHESAEGTGESAVNARLDRLQPHTTYHYRLIAKNGFGDKSEGSDSQFTTTGAPPAITAERAEAITETGATLRASINPENAETTYHFEYARSEALAKASTVGEASLPPALEEQAAGPVTIGGLAANTAYFYRAVASNGTSNGNGTTVGPVESLLTLPPPPVTGGAEGITIDEAVVGGTLNPGGRATHSYFEYGPCIPAACSTSSYTTKTVEVEQGSGTSPVEVAAKLTALQPLETYHYRMVASNAAANGGGRSYGPEQRFTTLPPAPAVTTDAPVTVASSSATLAGRIVPEGAYTTYRFEYGTSTTYGSSAPTPEGELSAAPGAQEVIVGITGLQPDSTYHYRLLAGNSGGATAGEDLTFTTYANGESRAGQPGPGFSLTGTAPPGPLAAAYTDLSGLAPQGAAGTPRPAKRVTKAQELARALRACTKNKTLAKRVRCQRRAMRRYGSIRASRASSSGRST
jgi:hypothetical protein